MHKIPKSTNQKQPGTSKTPMATSSDGTLHHLAFDNSLQANIITTVSSGKIITANSAACKLLGYSKKELLTKNRAAIFDINESFFKKMLKQRTTEGHSTALVTAIKKNRKPIPCEITSAVFMDEDGIEKSITTIADMRQSIIRQKNIDIKKEKIVANNIDRAKSKQKNIDTKKEKIVANNIKLAQVKSDSRLDQEIRLKEKQISEATDEARKKERSDIGKELHDNINQLLGASRLYLNMSKRGGKDSEMFLSRSSEYTLTAIEEIRKLTKVLTTDVIKKFGLCESIHNVTRDMMEVNPIKISCAMESFIEHSVNEKFKLNVFRIVQEQLNNILNHAQATEATISLSQNKKSIILTITDNGVGFDTIKKRRGIGIDNIKSRTASYNGTADFVSQPGKGCSLIASFPVKTL
jgi:PAS domain S-box-containing protein